MRGPSGGGEVNSGCEERKPKDMFRFLKEREREQDQSNVCSEMAQGRE